MKTAKRNINLRFKMRPNERTFLRPTVWALFSTFVIVVASHSSLAAGARANSPAQNLSPNICKLFLTAVQAQSISYGVAAFDNSFFNKPIQDVEYKSYIANRPRLEHIPGSVRDLYNLLLGGNPPNYDYSDPKDEELQAKLDRGAYHKLSAVLSGGEWLNLLPFLQGQSVENKTLIELFQLYVQGFEAYKKLGGYSSTKYTAHLISYVFRLSPALPDASFTDLFNRIKVAIENRDPSEARAFLSQLPTDPALHGGISDYGYDEWIDLILGNKSTAQIIDQQVKDRLIEERDTKGVEVPSQLWGTLGGANGIQTHYRTLYKIAAFLKFKKGEVFVDVGSGFGRVANFFNLLLHVPIRFVGYEIAPEKVKFSNAEAARLGLQDVKFIEQDLMSPKFSLPPADYYFLFDPTTDEVRKKVIADLKKKSLTKGEPLKSSLSRVGQTIF